MSYKINGINVLEANVLGTGVTSSNLEILGTQGTDLNMGSNNITNVGTLTSTTLNGTLGTAAQPNITSLGTLSSLNMGGNIDLNTNNIVDVGSVTATTLNGTLGTASQPNITSLGTLSSLNMGGNIDLNTNNIVDVGSVTATTLNGTLGTASQTNITSVGTLTTLRVQGDKITISDNGSFDIGINNGTTAQLWLETENFAGTLVPRFVITGGSDNVNYEWYNGINGNDFLMTLNNTGRLGIGITNPVYRLDVVGDIHTTTDYNINGVQVLNSTTLGSGIVNSSLTNVGTLTSLDMGGDIDMNNNDINNVDNVNATTLNGTLGTASQPNITSVGTLTTLRVQGDRIITSADGSFDVAINNGDGAQLWLETEDSSNTLSKRYTISGNTDNVSFEWFQGPLGITSVMELNVSGYLGIGVDPVFPLHVLGDINSSNEYRIGSVSVLNSTTLGNGVINSSLQNLGTQDTDLNMGSNNITEINELQLNSLIDGSNRYSSIIITQGGNNQDNLVFRKSDNGFNIGIGFQNSGGFLSAFMGENGNGQLSFRVGGIDEATNNFSNLTERLRIIDGGDIDITGGSLDLNTNAITNASSITVSDSVNSSNGVDIENTNSGASAFAVLRVVSDTSNLTIRHYGSGVSTNGSVMPNSTLFLTLATNGYSFTNINGDTRFYSGGTNASNTNLIMIIENGGDVGIGTDSPDGKLEIRSSVAGDIDGGVTDGDNTSQLILTSSDASTALFGALGAGLVFKQRWNNLNNEEVALGIIHGLKTTSNAQKGGGIAFSNASLGGTFVTTASFTSTGLFRVYATEGVNNGSLRLTKSDNSSINNALQQFYRGGTDSLTLGTLEGDIRLNGAGNLAFQDSSDQRLKENIVSYDNGYDKVKSLRTVEFEWKDQQKKEDIGKVVGFIAQEVQQVLPKAVGTFNEENGEEYLGVSTKEMIPFMWSALRKCISKIESLEQENILLKERLSKLEN